MHVSFGRLSSESEKSELDLHIAIPSQCLKSKIALFDPAWFFKTVTLTHYSPVMLSYTP